MFAVFNVFLFVRLGLSWLILGHLGAILDLLEASWGHLGAEMAPRWPQDASRWPKMAPRWPKIVQDSPKRANKNHQKPKYAKTNGFLRFLEARLLLTSKLGTKLGPFGGHLGCILIPKMDQDGPQMAP